MWHPVDVANRRPKGPGGGQFAAGKRPDEVDVPLTLDPVSEAPACRVCGEVVPLRWGVCAPCREPMAKYGSRGTCVDCGQERRIVTRGLCDSCLVWQDKHPGGPSRSEALAARKQERAQEHARLRSLQRWGLPCATCGRDVLHRPRRGRVFCDVFCFNHHPSARAKRRANEWSPATRAKMDARMEEGRKQLAKRRIRDKEADYRSRPEVRERRLANSRRWKSENRGRKRATDRAYLERKRAERQAQQAEGAETDAAPAGRLPP